MLRKLEEDDGDEETESKRKEEEIDEGSNWDTRTRGRRPNNSLGIKSRVERKRLT